jgi:hypothetical protein
VKSTGLNGFQELKAKDLLADTLVWIHFGDRFEEGSAPIQVAILENPGKYIQQPIRLDIPRLQRRIGSTPDLRRIEIRDLGEFLR